MLEGLGIVVQRWAYVEALEGEFLAYLTGATGGNLYVVTQAVSGKSITTWLRALADLRLDHKETRERVLDLLSRIDDARGERNALVHGLWSPGPESMTARVQTVKITRNEMIITTLVTVSDLADLRERIGEIITELVLVGANAGWHKPTTRTWLA